MGIYEDLKVNKVINAAGTWTRLGGSIVPREALEAMVEAALSFVDMEELHKRAGEIIANVTNSEAGLVTSGASAALVLAAAACITGTDRVVVERLPDTEGLRCEIIIAAGQRNPYDNCLRISGAKLIEVGSETRTSPREVEDAINEKTVAIAFFTRAHSQNVEQVDLQEVLRIAKRHDIPTIVDAAGELPPIENLTKFVAMGADLVAFSGGKGIGGPNATGILCGRADLIQAAFLNSYIAFETMGYMNIGRPMKVGRESIVGLLVALQKYIEKDHEAEFTAWDEKVGYVIGALRNHSNIETKRLLGNSSTLRIPYAHLSIDEEALRISTSDFVDLLKGGEPSIWVWLHEGAILINPRNLLQNEEKIIVQRIEEILNLNVKTKR